ncbi:MAG: DUF488 domain-containing protein, partial [Phycisphaerales bacterium]|nr:DUF488 domain-containing protein [Phycisphaerales bacterium]
TIVTIGYERRDGPEVMDLLTARGVSYLADIRQRPFSRKLDFRGGALSAYCVGAGIEYVSWSSLGSTREQRDEKEATGDIGAFQRAFAAHAGAFMDQPGGPLEELAGVVERRAAKGEKVALLCYERLHDVCHRKVIAELLAERTGAGVVAVE